MDPIELPPIRQNKPAPPLMLNRRKKQKFTLEDKLKAVAAMVRCGPGVTLEGIDMAREVMRYAPGERTLYRWYEKYHERVEAAQGAVTVQKPDTQIVYETDIQLSASLRGLMSKVLSALNQDEKIADSSLRDLAVVFGIAADKDRLFNSLSPEMTSAIRELAAVCDEKRIEPLQAIKDLTENIRQFVLPEFEDALVIEEVAGGDSINE